MVPEEQSPHPDIEQKSEIEADYTNKDLELDPSLDNDTDKIIDEVNEQKRGDKKNLEDNMEEINSNVELENVGSEQSTLILHKESQEPFSRDDEGNIILDADTLEYFGEHASSQEEMEVEVLEEEMEELFKSYEEHRLEQEEGTVTSNDLDHEINQEQHELEREFLIEQQEEKIDQKMIQPQEQELNQKVSQTPREQIIKEVETDHHQNRDEELQESLQEDIHEIKQENANKKIESREKDQEIQQEPIQVAYFSLDENDIKERYKQETGRRPIYARKETKGFIEWKEHLIQYKEEQEEKHSSLNEKEEEFKEQQKEIREYREEWAEYLVINIKESEFPEEITEKLDHFLDKYEKLRELLKEVKTKEISEEVFEKKVKQFEHILIEKSDIARPLFMNFDWYRKYYNETIRKSGKRVAKLYISKKTREFLSYISGRIKQLENRGNFYESAEIFEEFLEKSFHVREKWALQLNNLINEVPNEEISKEAKMELETVIKRYCEIRTIIFNRNILKEDKEKLIQGRIENYNPRFFELFEILKRFLGIYDTYSRNWMEQSLILEGKKTIRQLSQKLENIEKESVLRQILNEESSSIQNFKEVLKENLYKSTELRMSEKYKIIKIIQNENFSEENKVKLTNILSKLSLEESISFGFGTIGMAKQGQKFAEKEHYTKLLNRLRSEITNLVATKELHRNRLANWKLAKYLDFPFGDRSDGRKWDTVSTISKGERHITKEDLEKSKKSLLKFFGEKAKECISIINNFLGNNRLRRYSKQQWQDHNPNLNEAFFKCLKTELYTVDTAIPSYWYGFMGSDASKQSGLSKQSVNAIRDHRYRYQITIELSIKDKNLLVQFCETIGLDPSRIKERTREKWGKNYLHAYITFNCREMVEDLDKLGFVSSKEKARDVPDYIKDAMSLAFKSLNRKYVGPKHIASTPSGRIALTWLRGAYDGDGHSDRTELGSASRQFLESIRQVFKIRYPVRPHSSAPNFWILSLGARLFNAMSSVSMEYGLGLERKNKHFSESREALGILMESLEDLNIDKQRLKDLVYKFRQYELVKMFGTIQETFRKLLAQWNIKLPAKGYWSSNNKFLGTKKL